MSSPIPMVRLLLDGKPCEVPVGTTVAAACALASDSLAQRRSVSGQARTAFCGMGVCGECRVEINGRPHQLGCQLMCADGMQVRRADAAASAAANPAGSAATMAANDQLPSPASLETAHVLVVGAGPAGLAAAEAAALEGVSVLLLDSSAHAGGQIWRARRGQLGPEVAERLARLDALGVQVRTGTRVAAVLPLQRLLLDHGGQASVLHWQRLVLATGAREHLLPFPGWTRPGVFGAGGLQALAKGGWPVRGKRVLVAGSGPLLLASAASLVNAGAQVIEVNEEASAAALAGFAANVLREHRPLIRQAAGLARTLWRVPLRTGWRIGEASGDGPDGVLSAVQLVHRNGRTRTVACDALAAGWGLQPQTELAQALGCAVKDWYGQTVVQTDLMQRSTVPGIWVAGEPTGVAGMQAALLTGTLAGRAAARDLLGRPWSAQVNEHREQARHRRYGESLARTFSPPLRPSARWQANTLVCRCEDVPWADLQTHADLRSAKLATRCGMGHCQGRLCHRALALPVRADSDTVPSRPALGALPLTHWLALPPDPEAPANAGSSTPELVFASGKSL